MVTTNAWRPIETAPRDGTRILLWDSTKNLAVSGFWNTDPGIDTPNGYEPAWAWWVSNEDLVMWDGGPDDAPSYWQPLELPPECEAPQERSPSEPPQ